MAITINQGPSYPNVTYTNLLYAVSSNHVTASQFQYVMDIVSGSEILARIRQYPNPVGAGIFDPSRVLNDYLEYDINQTLTGGVTDEHPQLKTFEIKFGEQYGTSISSSVVLYNGNDSPGNPAVTGVPAEVFPGTVDPNNGVSYNWEDWSSAVLLSDRPSGIPVDPQNDIIYLTAYNGTVTQENFITREYNDAGTLVNTTTTTVDPGKFLLIEVNPNGSVDPATTNLTVEYVQNIITMPAADNCHWDRVNFTFINNYGFWEMYGVSLPQKKTTNVKRQSVTKPFVDYSSFTSPYNVSRRGKEYYNISYEDNLEVVTDWLSENQAEWLTQLIESPEVYIQQGTDFVPIVITNSSYEHNTNRRGQKLFQYNIQYQLANSRRSR